IGGRGLPNRIAMAPGPCGATNPDGFVSDEALAYYTRRASGGVGLIITEALRVTPPEEALCTVHLGIYADAFVPRLRRLVTAIRVYGARVIFTLDDPPPPALAPIATLQVCIEAFAFAAWRAHCAGADGVMLTSADGGLLYSLLSPLHNQRDDAYGESSQGRQRMAIEIIEAIRRWLGTRLIIGFRLLADEFTPGGLTLQDARMLAKRLTAAGVHLLDVTTPDTSTNVASFPGWSLPLANSIKRVVDVPVIGSGDLGDPLLVDSAIRDRSVDLIMLDQTLRLDPDWPIKARVTLDDADDG
ncbi:MAG: NADH:flavin oxidoreductase, partial [Chloroflexales bacterium]